MKGKLYLTEQIKEVFHSRLLPKYTNSLQFSQTLIYVFKLWCF